MILASFRAQLEASFKHPFGTIRRALEPTVPSSAYAASIRAINAGACVVAVTVSGNVIRQTVWQEFKG
jgi:hypothetical protein